MLSYELFSGLAFPYRIQSAFDGTLIRADDGGLFDAPRYREDQENFWRAISTSGWSRCPAGFAVYVIAVHPGSNELLIIHGLKVNGVSTAKGRADGLSIKLDREHVENYIENFLLGVQAANTRLSDIMAESIHEIRSVNTALYNAGYELQSRLSGQGIDAALSKNITALSEVLSLRMELMDFLAAYSANNTSEREEIPVFKKFDKICKCFRALAKTRNVDIQLSGNSLSTVLAPRSFELIPLLVLDNALKYSPDNKVISVDFTETATDIACVIRSIGPMVRDEEKDQIFQLGKRGEFAKKTGSSGSGIGLFFLQNLVKAAGGSVSFAQDKTPHPVKGPIPYRNTEFGIYLPKFNRNTISVIN
jgi:signal transduction histidine kinase